jgi:hypothetical protein
MAVWISGYINPPKLYGIGTNQQLPFTGIATWCSAGAVLWSCLPQSLLSALEVIALRRRRVIESQGLKKSINRRFPRPLTRIFRWSLAFPS